MAHFESNQGNDISRSTEYRSPTEHLAESPTIFIVEDDEAGREALIASLTARGYEVVAFGSADAFLRDADLTTFGCVITDFRMPGKTGIELQEELNARQSLLPVIMVSGFADVPVAVRAMQQGAITLLEKPYQNADLLDAIEQALERGHQAHIKSQASRDVQQRLARLSQTQLQVMKLLLEGKANKAVASQLVLGLRTVERHRQQILREMNVESLPELATLMASVGELPMPAEC